jgi:DNA-binding MarR family transcriptional regulator
VAISDGAVFEALAHETRRAIVERLLKAAASQAEIRADLNIRSGTASKHLGILEAAGLVTRGHSHGKYSVVLPSRLLELLQTAARLAESLAREQEEAAVARSRELRKLGMAAGAEEHTRGQQAG